MLPCFVSAALGEQALLVGNPNPNPNPNPESRTPNPEPRTLTPNPNPNQVSAAYEANYRQRMRAEEKRAAAAAGGDEQAAAEAQGERGDGLSFVWGLYGDFLRRIKSNVLRQRTIAAPLG